MNLEIDGYQFRHTCTVTRCGGAGIYIKNNHVVEAIDEFSVCIDKGKSLIVGCIYPLYVSLRTKLFSREIF